MYQQRNNRGFRGKPQGKKPKTPQYGAMWIAKSRAGDRIYRISVDSSVFNECEPDEKGRIHLIGFKNNYKESDQHPDVVLRFSEPLSKAEPGSRSAPRPKSRPAPAPVDDEDDDSGMQTTPSDDSDEDTDEEAADSSDDSDDELPF